MTRIPKSYRARYLTAAGLTELALGLMYTLDVSPARERLFAWFPFEVEWLGIVVTALSIAVIIAGRHAYRSRKWDRIGWMLVPVAPTALGVLWAFAGILDALDGDRSAGSGPWTWAILFAGCTYFTSVASTWPDPIPHPKDDG